MPLTKISFRHSLTGRLFAALTFVALISLGGLGLAAYLEERAALEAQVAAQLTSIAELKEEQITNWLAERQADVRLLAVNKLNQEHFTEILSPDIPAERKAEFASFLADNLISLQQSRAGYSQIVFADSGGTAIIATDPTLNGKPVLRIEAFRGALNAPGGSFIHDIHREPDTGEIAMDFGHVIRAVDPDTLQESPQVIGVVIITVTMDETIYPLIRAWPGTGQTGETLLVRAEGDETLFLNNLRFDNAAALTLRVPTSSPNAHPAHRASRGQEGIVQKADYRGVPVLAAYRYIPGINWGFVAKEDLQEAFAPVNILARRIGLVAMLALLMAGLISVAISRTLTRPLVRLVRGTRAVAAGNLTTEIGAIRRDEIGALAESFRQMVQALEARQQQVEAANRATQRRAEELKVASDILNSLNASPNVDQAFNAIIAGIRPIIGCRNLSLYLFSTDRQRFRPHLQETPLLPAPAGDSYPLSAMAGAADLLAGRVHYAPDLALETNHALEEAMYRAGYRSRLSLPLRAGAKTIGALSFNWAHPDGYNPAHLPLLSQVADAIALALERSQLFTETQRRSAELAALHDLSLAVNSSLEPADVMQMAVDRTAAVLNAVCAGIFLLDDDGAPRVGALSEATRPPTAAGQANIAPLLWQKLAASGRGIHIISLSQKAEREPQLNALRREGIETIILLRLEHSGLALGMLLVFFARPTLTPDETQLAQTIAQITSPAIAHAQSYHLTYEQLQQTNRHLALVNQIARRLSAILQPGPLLAEVVHLIKDSLSYDYVAVTTVDGNKIAFRSLIAKEETVDSDLNQEINKTSIAGQVVTTGEALLVNDIAGQNFCCQHPAMAEARSELGVPIRLAQHTAGALLVAADRPDAFDDTDRTVLQAIADQLALALENARSFSQLSQQAEVLAQTNAELVRATQAKTEFVNTVNHELRTPLTAIIGFTELLQSERAGPLNDKQTHFVERILSSSRHQLSLVNSLLDLAKTDAGKMELRLEKVHVAGLFADATGMLSAQAAKNRIELRTVLADPTLWLVADLTRLRQVLLNLLSNALKFTLEGGTITLRAQKDNGAGGQPQILFSVADTGIGIKDEDFPKVFGRFEQIDSAVGRSQTGTGLGLVVTRQLVELHQGRIWFESAPGKGTTFFVSFPATQPEPDA
ncbi:MAG: GAF domain-containing protein [Anaerolineae bacterium]